MRRALHYVFKIGDRKATATFYKDILGMKVLRHEEFEEGCKATCNGPYDGKWSKTMIGYGAEDSHFVCELTYNYGISEYPMGNGYGGMYITSSEVISRAKVMSYPMQKSGEYTVLEAPGGYKFYIADKPQPSDSDPVTHIELRTSCLQASMHYWMALLGMQMYGAQEAEVATISFASKQAKIIFRELGTSVDHAKAFGRVAFACPSNELREIESKMNEEKQKVLTPYVSLDTPGKATVEVVILADPDGHEICFVGEEGFSELSEVDPDGGALLAKAIEADGSEEWFAKIGGKKVA